MMEKTIKVKGTGMISVKPDLTIIKLDFSNICPTYEEALKASATDCNIVKKALEKVGIDKEELKTTSFDVDTHYKSYYDENKNYKSVLDGYEYNQSLKFEFPIDNKMLGRVLFQLSKLSVKPTFKIYYSVKDTEAAKNELLANAIIDAKKKALVISKAAGVTLDEIVDINYSWVDVLFDSSPYGLVTRTDYCSSSNRSKESYDIDVTPEDIVKRDNVTLVYKIK